MNISWNWLLSFFNDPSSLSPEKVARDLTLRGLEVESLQYLNKGLEHVVVGAVLEKQKHPDAERLSICSVDIGRETLQIVCGASNVRAGIKVPVALVGAILPGNFRIQKSKIRGVESFGMICSETELSLARESEGIFILPEDAPIGALFSEYLGRNDCILSFSLTPNRGDALSHLGIAREVGALYNLSLKRKEPAIQKKLPVQQNAKVSIQDKRCLQYYACWIEGVTIQESPTWLKRRLEAIGLRPINNVVDVTNHLLMELGQPMHVFDLDCIERGNLFVRTAHEREKLSLLDGSEIVLSSEDLIIADSQCAHALAGVMGGKLSQVQASTKNILLEVAHFSAHAVRKSSKRHQKSTDSSYRFERQIDASQVERAFYQAIELIVDEAGGKVSGHQLYKSDLLEETKKSEIPFSEQYLNEFMGTTLSHEIICKHLKALGFEIRSHSQDNKYFVRPPSYRNDIECMEDVCEEVLRAEGYDQVKTAIPVCTTFPLTSETQERARKISSLKNNFATLGFSEAVHFAFVSADQEKKWGEPSKAEHRVELKNPLNLDFSTLKTSLLSGLFQSLISSLNHQQKNLRLFEVRPVFSRTKNAEQIHEELHFAAMGCGRSFHHSLAARDHSLDFYDFKGFLENAFDTLGVRGVKFQGSGNDARFHPAQCAQVLIGNQAVGMIGRIHPAIEKEHKIKEPLFAFEINLDPCLKAGKKVKFAPISKFPKMDRDFSLIVPKNHEAEKVLACVQKNGKPLLESVSIVDLYEGEKIPAGHYSLSIAMIYGHPERTLEEQEVEAACSNILNALEKNLQVQLRLQ